MDASKALRVIAWGLGGIAIVQAEFLIQQQISRSGDQPIQETVARGFLRLGDSLGHLPIQLTQGYDTLRLEQLTKPVVFFVFRSDCAWCHRVADDWREWMSISREDIDVYALTIDSASVGQRYAADYSWAAQLGFLDGETLNVEQRALMSRTPWIFVIRSGRVEFESNGTNLDALDAFLDQPVIGGDE